MKNILIIFITIVFFTMLCVFVFRKQVQQGALGPFIQFVSEGIAPTEDLFIPLVAEDITLKKTLTIKKTIQFKYAGNYRVVFRGIPKAIPITKSIPKSPLLSFKVLQGEKILIEEKSDSSRVFFGLDNTPESNLFRFRLAPDFPFEKDLVFQIRGEKFNSEYVALIGENVTLIIERVSLK